MGIVKDYLDPNATTYTDLADLDATAAAKLSGIAEGAEVNPADLAELDATANTKLSGIEENAKADQTGAEIQTAVLGLADGDRVLIGSEPETGEKKVYGIHINAAGNIEAEQDTVAE